MTGLIADLKNQDYDYFRHQGLLEREKGETQAKVS